MRLRIEYVLDGKVKTRTFRARIARGVWKLDVRLPTVAASEIRARSGPLDAYALFAGDARRRLGGELRHAQILGAP